MASSQPLGRQVVSFFDCKWSLVGGSGQPGRQGARLSLAREFLCWMAAGERVSVCDAGWGNSNREDVFITHDVGFTLPTVSRHLDVAVWLVRVLRLVFCLCKHRSTSVVTTRYVLFRAEISRRTCFWSVTSHSIEISTNSCQSSLL